jgi:hypothetical protein
VDVAVAIVGGVGVAEGGNQTTLAVGGGVSDGGGVEVGMSTGEAQEVARIPVRSTSKSEYRMMTIQVKY